MTIGDFGLSVLTLKIFISIFDIRLLPQPIPKYPGVKAVTKNVMEPS